MIAVLGTGGGALMRTRASRQKGDFCWHTQREKGSWRPGCCHTQRERERWRFGGVAGMQMDIGEVLGGAPVAGGSNWSRRLLKRGSEWGLVAAHALRGRRMWGCLIL